MKSIIECQNVNVVYNDVPAIENLNININTQMITTLIGPSGCGKSTFLRSINRMNDFISQCCVTGTILFNQQDIYHPSIDPVNIRLQIGMVFQKPNPFPKSIYENITLVPRLNDYEGSLDELVKTALQEVYLWDEVRDKLHQSAYALSGGQQQRLCIARALAMQPRVLLMDEPTASLDPVSTRKIEDLMLRLKDSYALIVVTHNMQQANRIGDYTAFFYQGKLVEYGKTQTIFHAPANELTKNYVSGQFG